VATVISYTKAKLDALFALKADASAVTAALATKADDAATTAALATKASSSSMTSALALKADVSTTVSKGDVLNPKPALSTDKALGVNVLGTDAFDRLQIFGSGKIEFGTGAAARDSSWGRQGVAMVGTVDSDVVIGLAGKGLRIKEGTNARMGVATLVAGTITVANTSVTANTRIQLTIQNASGTIGTVYVSAKTAGTSFVITSTNAAHTSSVLWELKEPA
jgi:hypothetical protein